MGLGPDIEEEMRSWPLGQGPGRALAGPKHFLLNIRSQAHPNPSTSSLLAPGGRASGRLSSKKEIPFSELCK